MQARNHMMTNVPPPPSREWIEGKEWEIDMAARGEESKWPDQTALKGTKDVNILMLLQNSGYIAVGLMYFFAGAFVVSMTIWLIHFLAPFGWLQPEQLSKIQTVIFSGTLGAIVTAYAQKHIT